MQPEAAQVELAVDGFKTTGPLTVVIRLDLDAALHPQPEAEAG